MTNSPPAPPAFDITPVTIEEEMKRSYLDYAMSVIVSRALPDVRDGLKPVHRRILYSMQEGGYTADRPYRKSARIIGEVMGKYHPHGDAAIYDAMVRLAQDFSMRLPLIDGQGNFGSMDGDPAAAPRYTEARLARPAHEILADIDKDTVEFQPNYDGADSEPTVLPTKIPNLLVNGAGGIAVGMATNIPSHNLGEVIDACCALIDDPDISIETLMDSHLPGPDFPTGGIILGSAGIRAAYHMGRGSLAVRSCASIEEIRDGRKAIVVTEIPYQVNKSRMLERIAEVVNAKVVDGVSDLRDESDRHGVRVVVELKRDAVPEVVLNLLYRHTPLQTSFGVNMLALNSGRPELLNIKRVLEAFIAFREEVITRRTAHDLRKARERAHTLVGLAVAVANIGPVIQLIRNAKDAAEARAGLMATPWPASTVAPLIALIDEPGAIVGEDATYRLSEIQARAILDLRLRRLTGLEREKIAAELEQIVVQIRDYLEILASRERLYAILRAELLDVKERFADPRRTTLEPVEFEQDIEDLIPREDMVVTVTHGGYIKRVPLSTYRAQRRGGKGRAGMATRDEDFVHRVHVVNTHTPVLFFSSRGMVYKLKVYRLPLGKPQARGKAMVNLLPLSEGETITTLMPLPEDEQSWADLFLMFATATGGVRRNALSDFINVMSNGKIAMKLDPGDTLIGVRACGENDDALLATRGGKCIRFPVTDVRVFSGRTSTGVRGIRLIEDDVVISMPTLVHVKFDAEERDAYLRRSRVERAEEAADLASGDDASGTSDDATGTSDDSIGIGDDRYTALREVEQFVLTVTAHGFGKVTSAYEYRVTGRGGQGITNIDLGREPDNSVVASLVVSDADQIMLVTNAGQLIRTRVDEIRIAGRSTRGVTLFRMAAGERVVSVTRLSDDAGQNGDEAGQDGEADQNGDEPA